MKTIEWGFLIVNYLFLGGLSAGLFFVSALATFLYKIEEPSPYTRIARLGALQRVPHYLQRTRLTTTHNALYVI